jgi:DNA ligase (NAD+)
MSCPAKLIQGLIHFVSKAGLDIEGVGKRWIEVFVQKGLVKTPADLFSLNMKNLHKLDRMGEKLAQNMLDSLDKAKQNASLDKLISALGIRLVGEQNAKILASNYKDLDDLAKASKEELEEIREIGPEIAESIQSFFNNVQNIKLLENFKQVGLWPKSEHAEKTLENKYQSLYGKKFLFTGTLSSMSREQAKKRVEELGGRVVNNVSKRIDYLVLGENPGSKLNKIKEFGTAQIINEQEFANLF